MIKTVETPNLRNREGIFKIMRKKLRLPFVLMLVCFGLLTAKTGLNTGSFAQTYSLDEQLQKIATALDQNFNTVLDDVEMTNAITIWITGKTVPEVGLNIVDEVIQRIVVLWITGAKIPGKSSDFQVEEGEVGIVFRDGVECLGEDAEPLSSDLIYVSPEGDDLNAGNSPEAALRTLGQALCNVRPGQTVRILPGTYAESVILGAFGSPSAPITIQGVLAGDRLPILEGGATRTMGIALVESRNFVVENLEFRNFTDEGLYVLVGQDIIIRNNRFVANGRSSIDPEFDEEGFGLNVNGAKRVRIENNEVTQNGPSAERLQRGVLGTGIDTFELEESVILNNHSYDNSGGGILVEEGIGVLVEGNLIERNELDAAGDYWDGAIWVDGGHDVTVRANTISNNHGPGLQISDEDLQFPDASFGYRVEDNVITNNLFGLYIWNFGQCPFPPAHVVSFSNNVIEQNTKQDIWCIEFN